MSRSDAGGQEDCLRRIGFFLYYLTRPAVGIGYNGSFVLEYLMDGKQIAMDNGEGTGGERQDGG